MGPITTIETALATVGTMSQARADVTAQIAAMTPADAEAVRAEAARRMRSTQADHSALSDRSRTERGLRDQVEAARRAVEAWGLVVRLAGARR